MDGRAPVVYGTPSKALSFNARTECPRPQPGRVIIGGHAHRRTGAVYGGHLPNTRFLVNTWTT